MDFKENQIVADIRKEKLIEYTDRIGLNIW
jgi:hypothetical protein